MPLSEHPLLTNRLDLLKLKYFGSKDVILHRRELISATPPFMSLNNPETRELFNLDFISIVEEVKYRVIAVVIDKKALDENLGIRAQDPYALALEYLMQRYQYWMQDYCKSHPGCYGDILAESRGGSEDLITKRTYQEIYNGNGYNRLKDAAKYYSSKEIKLKPKKDNIAGLQFVDLLSHPARRYILSRFQLADNLKQSSFEQQIVNALVKTKFRRRRGEIEGAGVVIYPRP